MTANSRLRNEIEHHQQLIGLDPEAVWGWSSPAGRVRSRRRAALFAALGGLARDTVALELGCGTGVFTAQVARATAARLTAVDLSQHLLDVAGASIPGVRFVRADAENLPFPPASFDAVYGCSILHHLDAERALAEVHRILRPGGRLVFSEPNLWNPQVALMFCCRPLRPRFGMSPDEMAFTAGHATSVLRAVGFRAARVRHFDFLHPGTPAAFVDSVARLGSWLERVPGVRKLSGSLLIDATR